MNVSIFTGHEQTEQPAIVHHVTALTVVGDGLLTIECEVAERGHKFTAYHRFEAGQWTRFEVAA